MQKFSPEVVQKFSPGSQEAIKKDVDDANHAVVFEVIIDTFREQVGLVSVLVFNESTHDPAPIRLSVLYLLIWSFLAASI